MSNNKQSSVRWAIEQFAKIHSLLILGEIGFQNFNRVYNEIIEKADAMHKKECVAYASDYASKMIQSNRIVSAEMIYDETFGGNND